MQVYLIIQNNPYQNPIMIIVIVLLQQIDKIILKSVGKYQESRVVKIITVHEEILGLIKLWFIKDWNIDPEEVNIKWNK